MGAFDWVIAEVTCPACGVWAPLRCQTHAASDHGGDGDEEACYVTCEACQAALGVVLRFERLVPVGVVHVSLEADWPDAYWA